MADEDRDRIHSNRTELKKLIEFKILIPFIITKQVLNEAVVDEIQNNHLKNEDQVDAMLTALTRPSTSHHAFDQFIECLIETGHYEAAKLIRPEANLTEFGTNSSQPSSLPDDHRLKVKPVEPGKHMMPSEKCYSMTSRPRGYWIIVNNYEFDNRHCERVGSEKDAERLEQVAEELGFIVERYKNLSVDEMFTLMQDVSKRKTELIKHDALFVVIMSHGVNDYVYGSDGLHANVQDLKSYFYSQSCRELVNKPKVFIFVCCRGDDTDGPRRRSFSDIDMAVSNNPPALGNSSGDVCGKVCGSRRMRHSSGREISDLLTAYSTSPGFVNHRHHENGTYYVSSLVRVLMEHSCDYHLIKILQTVDREFSERVIEEEYMQTPGFEPNGFNKKLYFNPGYFEDDEN